MSNPSKISPSSTPDADNWLGRWEESSRRNDAIEAAPDGLNEELENASSLSSRDLLALDEERKHLGFELHDEVSPMLTALNLTLALLKKQAPDDHSIQAGLNEAQNLSEQTAKALHGFSRRLHSEMPAQVGLYNAICAEAGEFSQRTGIAVIVQSGVNLIGLDQHQETVLFRVVQESLTNIARHAHATEIQVGFRHQSHGITVWIQDNGQTIAVDQATGEIYQPRLGLLGLEERVRELSGDFFIDSMPGRGTTVVQVRLPFTATVAKFSSGTSFPNQSAA